MARIIKQLVSSLFVLLVHDMERVKGIGGVFFRAKDPKKLQVWYRKNVGIYRMRTGTGCLSGQKANRHNPASSMWAPFDQDTDYFGDSDQQHMVNYRVKNLDAMVTQLQEASVMVDKRIEDNEYGRFAWATDLEGNRFKLWQSPENQ